MHKGIGLLLSIVMSLPAFAQVKPIEDVILDLAVLQQSATSVALTDGLKWQVGDRATYKIISSVITGSSTQFVREDLGDKLWMQADVDMGFLGSQKMEMLFDKATGKILKLLVNGKEQTPPDPNDLDVLETRNERIRVAAGEFDCVYAKQRNRKDGKIQEGWTDDKDVPMGGMVRAMGNSPIGKVTQELQTYSFANQ